MAGSLTPQPPCRFKCPQRSVRHWQRPWEAHAHKSRKAACGVYKVRSNYPGEIPVLICSKNAVTQRLGTGRPHPDRKSVSVPKSWSFLQAVPGIWQSPT